LTGLLEHTLAYYEAAFYLYVQYDCYATLAMVFWANQRPGDVLISNGLAFMTCAVPAGIAMSLGTPERPVIAFSGDGGP
jgi:thiamine pyrophosphate-dependent acetolactate synthase large subunit-like protein